MRIRLKLLMALLMVVFLTGCMGKEDGQVTDAERIAKKEVSVNSEEITSPADTGTTEDTDEDRLQKDTLINENERIKEAQTEDKVDASNVTEPVTWKHKGGEIRDMTSMEIVADMGIGWNLGNTLEACGDWINGSKISSYETAWGNPITTKEMIDGIKEAGFDSVRIPVAWSNLITEDNTIHPELLDRVEEVINFCLENDMYAIVNIHWDNGWFSTFSKEYDKAMEKYTIIWTQIAERFKDYSDYLILESLNEEGCFDDIWNRYSGSDGPKKQQAYDILNSINQQFVDVVRGSGGNNERRHLLIAGYATDIYLTCDESFHLPQDPAEHMMVSVHYYTPSTFTILEEDADWGKAVSTWGSEAERKQLEADMNRMKETFIDKGIPVILGEYGSTLKNKDPESVRKYLTSVCKIAYQMGMVPMLWDPGTHYNRYQASFNDRDLMNTLKEITTFERY